MKKRINLNKNINIIIIFILFFLISCQSTIKKQENIIEKSFIKIEKQQKIFKNQIDNSNCSKETKEELYLTYYKTNQLYSNLKLEIEKYKILTREKINKLKINNLKLKIGIITLIGIIVLIFLRDIKYFAIL